MMIEAATKVSAFFLSLKIKVRLVFKYCHLLVAKIYSTINIKDQKIRWAIISSGDTASICRQYIGSTPHIMYAPATKIMPFPAAFIHSPTILIMYILILLRNSNYANI